MFEFTGEAISDLSMEERMTICNMSIEGGARAGMIAPDETTLRFFESQLRLFAPKGEELQEASEYWKTLPSDEGVRYDKEITFDANTLVPQVTWGTNPAMVADVTGVVPAPSEYQHAGTKDVQRALDYMDLKPGMKITDIEIDYIFIGSCTNGRIEDLRASAEVLKGRQISSRVTAWVVPGSMQDKKQAEEEGLDTIFKKAGCQWREPGCSSCLAMNPDKIPEGKRCASTSNRNFEVRQGKGARTHLVSPQMAAATAVEGRFVDVRKW